MNKKSLFIPLVFLGLSLITNYQLLTTIHADELEDIGKQIAELEQAKKQSEDATKPLEIEAGQIELRLRAIQSSMDRAAENIKNLEKDIQKREKDLSHQYELLSVRAENLYKQLRMPRGLLAFFSHGSLGSIARHLEYQRAVARQDKDEIISISSDLTDLENDKQKVEQDKKTLENLGERLKPQLAFFQKEIEGAKAYQRSLGQKITELSVKQKELLAKKTETFQTSVGSVPLADDPASQPGYNPGFSPAFAAFSFGAPHFKGMSQYGAYGRAKEGQSVEDILRAYYGGGIEIKKDYDTNIQIKVDGHGSYSLEEYAKRIYEVPNGWGDQGGMAALRAQAVAARSYALARTNNGSGSICATEACQVFKPEPKGGNWEQAVNDTKGWVLVANGQPFSAWYASTSGGYQESYSHNGYSTPGFWDTKNGRSGWTSDAYEKIGGSPWFYKAWYRTRGGTTCGRSHPWLTSGEFADIVNALIVYKADNGTQEHLSQVDSSCFGESIPDTWSREQLRNEANNKGGAVSSVNSVSVTYSNSGVTAEVAISTNRGTLRFSGDEFYKIFNLRAPGAIHLTSGLFNIEKK